MLLCSYWLPNSDIPEMFHNMTTIAFRLNTILKDYNSNRYNEPSLAQSFTCLPLLVPTCYDWKTFLCRILPQSIRQYRLRTLLGPCKSGMGRGLRPSTVLSPNSHFLLYACIPTTGWMPVVTSLVIATLHSNTSADSRPRAVTSQLRVYRRGDCGGETVHTGSGWNTPRVGGACETNGPPCQIRSSHPRLGRYATSLLGAEYSLGVVTRGLHVFHVPALIILTFKFTDAIFSTILACDSKGDSAPNLHERKEMMRHSQPASYPCSLTCAALALPERSGQPFKGAISWGSHFRATVARGLLPSARICGPRVS